MSATLRLETTPPAPRPGITQRSIGALAVCRDPSALQDPEVVHRARVATRRLRTFVRCLPDLVPDETGRALRTELVWIGDRLGAVRDIDVMIGSFQREAGEMPPSVRGGLAALLEDRTAERAGRLQALRLAVEGPRFLALVQRLERVAAAAPPFDEDSIDVRAAMRPRWKALRAAADRAPCGDADAALHEVRIRAKRARYAAELLVPSVSGADRFMRRAKRLQQVLGVHQDAAVELAWLLVPSRGPERSLAAGWLAARAAGRRTHARSAWHEPWRALRRRGARFW